MEKITAVEIIGLTAFAAAANREFGTFIAPFTGTINVLINLSSNGILSMTAKTIGGPQVNTTAQLLDGAVIAAGQWQTIQIPVTKGSSYSFQVSVGANVTLQVIGVPL